ncbi:MAG: aminoacyl-tRNA hydrolase [Pseudomonadota bacterium]
MRLLVGLGNPGTEHEGQRHNVGFMAVEAIGEAHNFGPERSKFRGRLREGALAGIKTLLLKPQTYMNESGRSVGEAVRFFKLAPGDVTVFYDELDLAPGKVRVKTGGGAAGHNGIKSIAAHIGPDFERVRIGIGHPGDKSRVTGHVLGDFSKTDRAWVEPLLDAVARQAPLVAAGDGAGFMSRVANDLAPPRPASSAASKNETAKRTTADRPEEAAGPLADGLRKLLRGQDE